MTRFLKIVNREAIGRDRWDAFVDSVDEAWLWHRFDLQDALSTWPGRHDLSFAILDCESGGDIVTVVPLHIIEARVLRFFSWNVLDSMGGPALVNGVGERQKHKIREQVRECLIKLAMQYDALEINLHLPALAPAYRGARCPRINPLLDLECNNTLTQTWIVDLRPGKDGLWKSMEGRARTAIRKAEKEGVSARPATHSKVDLDTYYGLHCETYLRTGVRPHPKSYFESIWDKFLSKGFSYILFAEHNGKVVAAENFGVYKRGAVYWTGAASEHGLKLEANSLLQWTAIQWMVEQGMEWYETGEAFPHIREGKLKGLNDFKKSFGGTLYPYYRGKIDTKRKMHKILLLLREVMTHS